MQKPMQAVCFRKYQEIERKIDSSTFATVFGTYT